MTETCYTLKDLRSLAKDLGIRGYSSANKAKLLEMLDSHANTKSVIQRARGDASEKTEHKTEPKPKHEEQKVFVQEAPPAKEEAAPTEKKKRNSPWNTFLTEYCKDHGCPLKTAMTMKDEYAAWKAKQAAKK